MGQREFIVLISLLMALTALAIDLMLPAFGVMRESFGLRSTSAIRIRTGDAREVLTGLPDARYQVIIRDAFEVDAVPRHLRTRGFVEQVARVLSPGGTYVANIADGGTMEASRHEAATALTAFRHLALIAEPAQFHHRRFGNVVLVASSAPLPLAALGRRLASGPIRASMLEDDEVTAFVAGRRPLED